MSDQRAAPPGTGTIADTYDPLPDTRPAPPPLREPASLGELWNANRVYTSSDASNADDLRISQGYEPIVQALGLDEDQNPVRFFDSSRFGLRGPIIQPSALSGQVITDRATQELAIIREIQRRRAANPNFLPGVPDTVEGMHAYFVQQEQARRAQAADTMSRSPGGFLAGATTFAAGAFQSQLDPLNMAAAALPVARGASLLRVAAREAAVNAALELVEQPIIAHNRAQLGEDYTLGEGVENVLYAAAGGTVLGTSLHGFGRGVEALRGGEEGAAGRDILNTIRQSGWDQATIDRAAAQLQSPALGVDVIHDALGRASNSELSYLVRTHGGPLTPDQQAALAILDRAGDEADRSPFIPGPAADAGHDLNALLAQRALADGRVAPDVPPTPPPSGASIEAPGRPPARSTGGRPPIVSHGTSAPVDTEAAIADYIAHVGRHESGNANIRNRTGSSASGRFQFTDDTFRRYYIREYGRDPGPQPPQALKYDDAVEQRLMTALTRDNASALQRAGQPVNRGNLYLLHFAGPPGLDLLRADPSARATDVWLAALRRADPRHADARMRRIVQENPGLIEGKTASEVVGWAHRAMGGSAASVPLRAGIATGGDVTEDALVAQLRSEAMNLSQQAVAGEALPNGAAVPPMATRQFRPDDLIVDPATFQFKAGGDDFGVTDRLAGVNEWNPIYAGRLVAWEDLGGRFFVADGHQRVGLARRIEAQTGSDINLDAVVLREADGVTAQDARVWAALKNIAEGTGTAVDAAKVIRDAGPEILRDLPPRSPLVRDGAALARLSDDAFGAVWNGRIASDQAAVIGHLVDNRDAHASMVDLLLRLAPANRGQAESIIRQALAAGFHKEEQIGLFGSNEVTTSLFMERARVLERGLARLRKMKLVYGTAAEHADTLEEAGSTIARTASQKEAARNGQALELVSRLAFSRGPVADALNRAAAELAGGKPVADVTSGFVDAVRGIDLQAAAKDAGGDAGSRLAPDGAGRGGDAGSEGALLPAERGDPGVAGGVGADRADGNGRLADDLAEASHPSPPTLFEQDATERFSDPDGEGAKAQTEQLEHDARMDAEAVPAVHPVTGETIDQVKARAFALRNSFEPIEKGELPGTHNIPSSAPAPGGGTRGELRDRIRDALLARPATIGHEAHILLGPPGAGKTTLANPIAARFGARVIDADDAKAMLPEYENGIGAPAVHEESSLLAALAADQAERRGDNIVLPTLGRTAATVAARIEGLVKRGYRVYVHLVDLPADQAAERAVARFGRHGRFIDPDYVRSVAATSRETFDKVVADLGDKLEGYLHVSNDVSPGEAPRLVRASSDELARGLGLDPGSGRGEGGAAAGGKPEGDAGGAHEAGVPGLESPPVPLEPGRLQIRRVGRNYVVAGDRLDEAARAILSPRRGVDEGGHPVLAFPNAALTVDFAKLRKTGIPLDLVDLDGNVTRDAKAKDIDALSSEQLDRMLRASGRGDLADAMKGGDNPLDRGAEVDPAVNRRAQELADAGAKARLGAGAADQKGEMGLGLFDAADQPGFRLDVEGPERTAKQIFAELDADEKALDALEACMKPRAAA